MRFLHTHGALLDSQYMVEMLINVNSVEYVCDPESGESASVATDRRPASGSIDGIPVVDICRVERTLYDPAWAVNVITEDGSSVLVRRSFEAVLHILERGGAEVVDLDADD